MAYADVEVIVDGCVDQSATFHDYTLLYEFIAEVREDAEGDGYPTEIFILYHSHGELINDEDCACAQYVQNHKPAYSFNMED